MGTESQPRTYLYKSVNGTDVACDVHLPPNAKKAPVLLWFHGGGLLQGRRDTQLCPHMRRGVAKYNFVLVTADYRLAPQVSVEEIFSDVADCISWIRNELAKELGDAVDASRLAVSGSSAGGYLSLLAGLYVSPKPQVILPIYPITDPLGTFFITPQPQADWTVTDGSPTRKEQVAPFLDHDAQVQTNSDDAKLADTGANRNKMYFWMMQNACLGSLFHLDTENPHNPSNQRWRISRNIREHGLPHCYLVHGDADRSVGVEQADEVAGTIAGLSASGDLKVDWQYERLKDADHLFDGAEEVELEGMYRFMMNHL